MGDRAHRGAVEPHVAARLQQLRFDDPAVGADLEGDVTLPPSLSACQRTGYSGLAQSCGSTATAVAAAGSAAAPSSRNENSTAKRLVENMDPPWNLDKIRRALAPEPPGEKPADDFNDTASQRVVEIDYSHIGYAENA